MKTEHVLGKWFTKARSLDFCALARLPQWKKPLEGLFVSWRELVYLHRHLLDSEGVTKPGKTDLWRSKVLMPARAHWPKWTAGIEDVPLRIS